MNKKVINVLMVEDLLLAQRVAAEVFRKLNCKLDIAITGSSALQKLLFRPFDIIFIDLNLPDIDGIEITKTIRSMERKSRIPVIALTANTHIEPFTLLHAGFDDYLFKPLTIESAGHVIHKHLGNKWCSRRSF